jgi:hypothetical protein
LESGEAREGNEFLIKVLPQSFSDRAKTEDRLVEGPERYVKQW